LMRFSCRGFPAGMAIAVVADEVAGAMRGGRHAK